MSESDSIQRAGTVSSRWTALRLLACPAALAAIAALVLPVGAFFVFYVGTDGGHNLPPLAERMLEGFGIDEVRKRDRVRFAAGYLLIASFVGSAALAGSGVAMSLWGISRGRSRIGTRRTLAVCAFEIVLLALLTIAGFRQTEERISRGFRINQACVYSCWWVHRYDRRAGLIDSDGSWVVRPRFDMVNLLSQGLAVVRLNGRWGVVDKEDRYVVEPRFDECDAYYFEGYLAVRVEGKWGYVDRNGSLAIEPRFESAGRFGGGLAPVRIDGKWGYIDTSGEVVIGLRFSDAGWFREGLAPVKLERRRFVRDAGEGTARTRRGRGRWGYIDRNGDLVIPAMFDDARPFDEGEGAIRIGKLWGSVRRDGTFTLEEHEFLGQSFDDALPTGEPFMIRRTVTMNDETLEETTLFFGDSAIELLEDVDSEPQAVFDLQKMEWTEWGSGESYDLPRCRKWEVDRANELLRDPDPAVADVVATLLRAHFHVEETDDRVRLAHAVGHFEYMQPLAATRPQLERIFRYLVLAAYRAALTATHLPPSSSIAAAEELARRDFVPGRAHVEARTLEGKFELDVQQTIVPMSPETRKRAEQLLAE